MIIFLNIPLVVIYHCMRNPFLFLEASETNLIKSELPIDDTVGRILEPQYFPIKGDVEYPPFLFTINYK